MMKTTAAWMALFATTLLPAAPASAQDGRDVATVVGLYVEQAPGVYTEMQLARGRGGPHWAEVRREGAQGKPATEMVKLPAGVTLRPGDRVYVAGTRSEPSASTGSSAPTRVGPDPQLERPLDISGPRAPQATRPLAVVPGSCIPF